MERALSQLIDLLDLEEIERNHYRGQSPAEGWQRVYGGQVLGQALVAASRTVDDPDRHAHSLHAYFLRAGDPDIPLLYVVDRIRDGRSFTTRRVVAIQRGRPIFNMAISFHRFESGLEYQDAMPCVPDPETLRDEHELRAEFARKAGFPPEEADGYTRERPMDVRPVDVSNELAPEVSEPHHRAWMKVRGALPDDERMHQCVLAYLSDWSLLDTCCRPHGVSYMSEGMQMASLDHAMWFHRPFRADDWLLFVHDSPAASGARGFNRGLIHARDGSLIATVGQEGLIRMHTQASH